MREETRRRFSFLFRNQINNNNEGRAGEAQQIARNILILGQVHPNSRKRYENKTRRKREKKMKRNIVNMPFIRLSSVVVMTRHVHLAVCAVSAVSVVAEATITSFRFVWIFFSTFLPPARACRRRQTKLEHHGNDKEKLIFPRGRSNSCRRRRT